uniref:Uncharacterized protein n=1 Tax=Rhodococcus sp. NS1 TaxID=402236 RepID=A0A097SQV4_9NOCA|nr:hypothetical protein LRS1606.477 [Rhodococcus sp. NS1]
MGGVPMQLFVGDDWSEEHHDVELMDSAGRRLSKARLPEGVAGVARLHGCTRWSATNSATMSTSPRWRSESRPTVARGWRRWWPPATQCSR